MSRSASLASQGPQLSLDAFVMRQFGAVDPSFTGQRIDCTPQDFENRINALYDANEHEVRDGHAPFCKHIFVPNFIENLMPSVVEITPANKDKLRTSYEQRSENDLAVLVYGNCDIIFEKFRVHFSAPPHPARTVYDHLLSAHADWALTGC